MTKSTTITIDESRRGRASTTTADPLTIELDEDELAKGPAEAIAQAARDGITGISKPAKPETVARRRRDGSSSSHLFYASGTLARGITAVPAADGKGYDVTAPPDRLKLDKVAARLRAELPALAEDPTKHPTVARALEKADASITTSSRRRR